MSDTNRKRVKYLVTGAFGTECKGDIIDTIPLIKGNGGALVYHPRTKGSCASLEMVKWEPSIKAYVSLEADSDMFGWINIDSQRKLAGLLRNLSELSYRDTKRTVSAEE